jgi:hypothetical protein
VTTSSLSSTLASYATTSNPSLTGFLQIQQNGSPGLLAYLLTDGHESSLGFYRYNAQSISNAGDYWSLGQACQGAPAGGFGIGTSVTGLCLSISAAGVVNVPIGLTFQGYGVATTQAVSAVQPWVGGRISGSTGTKIAGVPAAQSSWTSASLSTGVFQVTMATSYGSQNYCVTATAIYNSSSVLTVNWATVSNTVFNLYVRDASNNPLNYAVNFIVY